jgi:hypothetical protein
MNRTTTKRGGWVKAAVGALLGLMASVTWAQYAIDWFTIDGGGGKSTGGVYTVIGTIGQPDAGSMTGGNFTVEGGFWGVAVIQTPGAPILSVARTNANVLVSWPAPAPGWTLGQTNLLTGLPGAWPPVTFPYVTNGGVISVTVPATGGPQFFRLQQP